MRFCAERYNLRLSLIVTALPRGSTDFIYRLTELLGMGRRLAHRRQAAHQNGRRSRARDIRAFAGRGAGALEGRRKENKKEGIVERR